MLCSVNGNELTFYEVKLNKKRLKKIRNNIITKYGKNGFYIY